MPDLHLHHVTAVTMDDHATLIADAAIAIADARIVYVGPQVGAPVPRDGDEVIDGTLSSRLAAAVTQLPD